MTKVSHVPKDRRGLRPFRDNIRGVQPPERISTKTEAKEVLRRYRQYSGLADTAEACSWRVEGGTQSHRDHLARRDKYDDLAERWLAVLEQWLDG